MVRPTVSESTFSAIAHPTRRAVLNALMRGQGSANALRNAVPPGMPGTSQAAFSEHLAILSRAGLVRAKPQGRERIYALNAAPLAAVFEWLKQYEAFWDDRLARLGDYLDSQASGR